MTFLNGNFNHFSFFEFLSFVGNDQSLLETETALYHFIIKKTKIQNVTQTHRHSSHRSHLGSHRSRPHPQRSRQVFPLRTRQASSLLEDQPTERKHRGAQSREGRPPRLLQPSHWASVQRARRFRRQLRFRELRRLLILLLSTVFIFHFSVSINNIHKNKFVSLYLVNINVFR